MKNRNSLECGTVPYCMYIPEGVLVLAAQHELGVIHQVEGEDEGSRRSVPNHRPPGEHSGTLHSPTFSIGTRLRVSYTYSTPVVGNIVPVGTLKLSNLGHC